MRQADVSDAESLQSAFKNVHVIYAMTDFWQTMSGDVEYTQGKTIVDIAENLPGLEHFVWASLPDAKRISNGRFSNVFHWQSKAAVADYIKNEKPRLWTKTTVVLFPNYFENCLTQANLYLPVKVSHFPLVAHGKRGSDISAQLQTAEGWSVRAIISSQWNNCSTECGNLRYRKVGESCHPS